NLSASYQATLTLAAGDRIDFAVGVGANGNNSFDSTGVNALIVEGVDRPPEPGLPGWTVYLDQNQNGLRDPGEPVTTSDADGHYPFPTRAPGSYRVAEALPSGWVQTAPTALVFTPSLTAGQVQTGLDFGNRLAASVGGNAPPVFSTTSVAVGQLFTYAA